MHPQHERKPGRFHEFRPPEGPFPRVCLTDCLKRQIVGRLRAHVDASPWRYMMRRAAHAVIDRIERCGLRFEMPCAELSQILGLSHSMGGYYLRRLREAGFLDRYREHYVDWEATEKLRQSLDDESIYYAAPAVHELEVTRWGWVFQSDPRNSGSSRAITEKRAPSWESVFRRLL